VKCLGRIRFNGLTALSLLLCVGSACLWLRSYWIVDSVAWNRATAAVKLATSDCTLEFWYWPGRLDGWADGWSYESWRNDRTDYVWGIYEFRADGQLKMAIPLWLLCLVTAVLAATRLISQRYRASGWGVGMCPSCGYDLRATPERCPECGAAAGRAD
jgi:hypothetical protein